MSVAEAGAARAEPVTAGRTFTRLRIERILAIAIAFGSSIMGVQALINALAHSDLLPGWSIVLPALTFVSLTLFVVAAVAGVRVALFSRIFCGVYVLVLVVWPFGAEPAIDHHPWMWYLINVAAAASVVASPLWLQITAASLVPLVYAYALVAGGADENWITISRDVIFAMILAGVVISLSQMLRIASSQIDYARVQANASYAAAAAATATEKERVAVAALMHDSVLAALIATERAHSDRERTLATAMAREALTRLANAERESEEGSDDPMPVSEVADAMDRAALEIGIDLVAARDIAPDAPDLPGRVGRAIALAGSQAVANAIEHAGGAGLSAEIVARGTAVLVRVRDTGDGFELGDVPEDRLGIRGSIFARIAAVAGHSRVDSGPSGTTVSLTWEHPQ